MIVTHRSGLVWFLLLLAAGFVFRLGLIIVLRDVHREPHGLSSADDVEFHVLALNLAAGNGFVKTTGRPTSFRAPGWPFFLACIYKIAGNQPLVVYCVNCVLGATTAWLAYLIGRRLLDERLAGVAGLIAAVSVPHAYFATLFLSENLFAVLLGLSTLLLIGHQQGRSFGRVTVAGLVIGLAILTRPFALLLIPIWALVLLRGNGAFAHRLIASVLFSLTSLGVVLPWSWRNYQVHQQPVLIATNGGSTFYGGNNDRVIREWRLWGSWVSTTELPHRDLIEAAPNEVAHDRVEWWLGKEWVLSHPFQATMTVPLKVLRLLLWLPDFDGGQRWYYLVRAAAYLPFVPLLLLGSWRCLRSDRLLDSSWLVVHGVIAATIVTAVIFWGSPRFRDVNAAVLPLYIVVGIQTWARCWRRLRASNAACACR